MSTMDKRVERLELEAAAQKEPEPPRWSPRIIGAKDGETSEQAVARWKAEHPGETVPDGRCGRLNFIVLHGVKPARPIPGDET